MGTKKGDRMRDERGRNMIGVCVIKCTKCKGKCTCGTAKGPHFKSPEHRQEHMRFVKTLFSMINKVS